MSKRPPQKGAVVWRSSAEVSAPWRARCRDAAPLSPVASSLGDAALERIHRLPDGVGTSGVLTEGSQIPYSFSCVVVSAHMLPHFVVVCHMSPASSNECWLWGIAGLLWRPRLSWPRPEAVNAPPRILLPIFRASTQWPERYLTIGLYVSNCDPLCMI